MKRLARYKHSGLFIRGVNDDGKGLYFCRQTVAIDRKKKGANFESKNKNGAEPILPSPD
jgi:hypothetical protein